jgi:hypothetical protein
MYVFLDYAFFVDNLRGIAAYKERLSVRICFFDLFICNLTVLFRHDNINNNEGNLFVECVIFIYSIFTINGLYNSLTVFLKNFFDDSASLYIILSEEDDLVSAAWFRKSRSFLLFNT